VFCTRFINITSYLG